MKARVDAAHAAGGGGYLCSTAHMIRPEVPWENIMAFVEAVCEYGHP
jgi:uroporphyrinogen-III decarboxylase